MAPPPPVRFRSLRWRILPLAIGGVAVALLVAGALIAGSLTPTGSREAAQQLVWVVLALVGLLVAGLLWVVLRRLLDPIAQVGEAAEKLAAGEVSAPTGMSASDEIGRVGAALDRYAARVQEKQEALRDSLRRQRRELEHFTAMIESLPDGVIVQDIDGHVTFINTQARQLIGEKYNHFRRATDQEITAAVIEQLGGLISPGISARGTAQRIALDGRVLSVSVAAIRSLLDHPIGTVLTVRDVTAQAQRDEARAALLEQAGREWGISTADIPTRTDADDAARFEQEARRWQVAVGGLLASLRELTAVDARAIRSGGAAIALDALLHAIANEWRASAHAANLTLDVAIAQPGLMVTGDERRLRWAIGNLVDNAVKYTPPGGRVSLEVKGAANGYARVRVRDTGAGIAPEALPHIFERFFRAAPTLPNGRVIAVPGTGMGLAVARDIVTAHGGTIVVRSTPGVGTAVYLTLPLEGTPLPITPPPPDDEE